MSMEEGRAKVVLDAIRILKSRNSRCTDYRKYYGTGQHGKFRYGAGYFL